MASCKQRIKVTLDRLPIQQLSSQTLSLAESYLRRSTVKFSDFKTSLEILAIDLACSETNAKFCRKDVVEIYKYSIVEYMDEFSRLARALGVQLPAISFERLCVMFGSVISQDSCSALLDDYKMKCKDSMTSAAFRKMDFGCSHLILAVFETAMKTLKMKVDKQQFAFMGGNSKIQKNYSKDIAVLCKEFLKELKLSKSRRETPSQKAKRARILKDSNLDARSTRKRLLRPASTSPENEASTVRGKNLQDETLAGTPAGLKSNVGPDTPSKTTTNTIPQSLQKPKKATRIKKVNLTGMVIFSN